MKKSFIPVSIDKPTRTTMAIAALVSSVLLVGAVGAFMVAKSRTPQIILPAGNTYLGNTPTQTVSTSLTIPVPANTPWSTYKGKVFPYSFEYPNVLNLGVFPNDQFDSVTIFWNNTNSQENVFFRVENLNSMKGQEKYIAGSKEEYAKNWWRQYTWKGVSDVTPFTNSKGLHGYRAKYIDAQGKTPFDNIFLEVPGRPELVIWMASGLTEPAVFDKMVDSVAWSAGK